MLLSSRISASFKRAVASPNRQRARPIPGDDDAVVRARWDELRTQWLATVERLASEYLGGTARVQPAPDVCRLCALTVLCRRLETAAEGASEESGGADE